MTGFAIRRAVSAAAIAVAIATGVVACGPAQPPNGSTATQQTQETPAIAAVRALFDTYSKATIGPRGQEVDWSAMRSARLAARFAALPARQLESDEPILDFDPVVAAQDWDITDLKLAEAPASDSARRVVTATFENFDEPRTIQFEMVEEGGAWKVDNIRAPEPLAYDVNAIFDTAGVK